MLHALCLIKPLLKTWLCLTDTSLNLLFFYIYPLIRARELYLYLFLIIYRFWWPCVVPNRAPFNFNPSRGLISQTKWTHQCAGAFKHKPMNRDQLLKLTISYLWHLTAYWPYAGHPFYYCCFVSYLLVAVPAQCSHPNINFSKLGKHFHIFCGGHIAWLHNTTYFQWRQEVKRQNNGVWALPCCWNA